MEGYRSSTVFDQAKRHRNLPINTPESLLHPILLHIAFGNMLKQANLENNDLRQSFDYLRLLFCPGSGIWSIQLQ